MVPDVYKIPFASAFVIFLIWFIVNLVHQFSTFKTTKSDTVETPADATTTTAHTSTFGYRAGEANRTLLDGLYLLSIAVIFNVFMLGNKASNDTFSLIAMFALIFAGGSHFAGIRIAAKGLWIVFLLAIFALFVTAFATPGPAWYYPGYYPYGPNGNPALNPALNPAANPAVNPAVNG
ncbi:hypothetical protein CONCODRAFT_8184 [Conidiobolus coronatus NRRL 28638]|uniref:Uncharacterized protein n=1 Tax=Conidiobolus coronatus (strain ATCC 28846 / CBS 209.66 / NRRL 28638) TaxID=796925 RepID=A0A137P393_CONC2|nr:hypothetical protein CONCODRAFT_8184 [Conidiobolus coronatus NRRL 28638]|eukprot:KXN69391.1 hypothetical protein CONCODRAFT_8184 [Conidiobolus coronatus NRRL 28638]